MSVHLLLTSDIPNVATLLLNQYHVFIYVNSEAFCICMYNDEYIVES